MSIFSTFLKAATAALRAWPLFHLNKLYEKLDDYEDEIERLGRTGTAYDQLQLVVVSRRKERVSQQISAIRAAIGDTDPRD